ncbi:hypothetical protein QF048_003442 [Streptomyces sp. W4I9-2]|nr:hypothetical protein [Streptomyces sp. W4I9-2]MDQ0697000.1 hypothetical protein [Streptomyces sp. W4I9-2]
MSSAKPTGPGSSTTAPKGRVAAERYAPFSGSVKTVTEHASRSTSR